MIEDSDIAFDTILECANGREALNVLQKEDINLVITDIRMPEMDGISLMQSISNKKPVPRFIVLSGYDDFNYAKESINYGARAYILKPLDRDELINTIKRIVEEIKREKEHKQKEEKLNLMVQKLREDELRLILLNSLHMEDMAGKLEETEFVFKNCEFYVTLIVNRSAEQTGVSIHSRLQSQINDYFVGKSVPYLCMEVGRTLLLITADSSHIENLTKFINSNNRNYFAAISNICKECCKLREAYLQATEALKYRYVFPNKQFIYYNQILTLRSDYSIPTREIHKVGQIIGTEKFSTIDELISNIFDKRIIVQYKIDYLEQITKSLYDTLTGIVDILSYKWSSELKKYDTLVSIYNFDSVKAYLNYLKEFVQILNSYILTMKNACRDKNDIDKAIEYIENNYDRYINLAMVSNHVSLNYSYFSHAFRERTGVSFIEYLRRIRINKAMELLENTDMKVYEISEKVGFENHKHFTRAFREQVGISPMEYREKVLMQGRHLK